MCYKLPPTNCPFTNLLKSIVSYFIVSTALLSRLSGWGVYVNWGSLSNPTGRDSPLGVPMILPLFILEKSSFRKSSFSTSSFCKMPLFSRALLEVNAITLVPLKYFTFHRCSPGKVWQDFVDWPIRHIFVDWVSCLAKREGEVVTHAQQLSKTDEPFISLQNKILNK